MGSIVPKKQNFKCSNERMADIGPTVYSLLKIRSHEEKMGGLGKPLYKRSAVQTEIRRKGGGGGVENQFQIKCGSSSVNINHY